MARVDTLFRKVMDWGKLREMRKPLDEKLHSFFPKGLEGVGGATSNAALDNAEGVSERDRLADVLRTVSRDKYSDLPPSFWTEELTTSLLCYPFSSSKQKTSRKVAKLLTKRGYDTNNADIQKWLQSWYGRFATFEFRFSIGITPEDFDLLGHVPPDKEGGSCYKKGGQHQFAPASLASGLRGKYPTYVLFIKDVDNKIVARAWGFTLTKDVAIITNGYYVGGFRSDSSVFIRALEAARGIPLKSDDRYPEFYNKPFYINSDTQRVLPSDGRDYFTPDEIRFDRACFNDGTDNIPWIKHHDERQSSFGFCPKCLDAERYIPCPICGGETSAYRGNCATCGVVGACLACYKKTHVACPSCGVVRCGDWLRKVLVCRCGEPACGDGMEALCPSCIPRLEITEENVDG